jgi:hypothetical protein
VWLRSVWLRVADLAGKFPFPDILRPEQKVTLCAVNKTGHLLLRVRNASVATNFRLFTFGLSLPIFLVSQIVLRSAYVERRTSSIFSPSLQGGSARLAKIADEFEDDLIDDRVRKGRKSAERSTVSARKTAMT